MSIIRSSSCAPTARNSARIAKLIEDDTIRPVIDRVLPFAQLNDALAYIDTGRAKGKVVVTLK